LWPWSAPRSKPAQGRSVTGPISAATGQPDRRALYQRKLASDPSGDVNDGTAAIANPRRNEAARPLSPHSLRSAKKTIPGETCCPGPPNAPPCAPISQRAVLSAGDGARSRSGGTRSRGAGDGMIGGGFFAGSGGGGAGGGGAGGGGAGGGGGSGGATSV